jgi:hypothetical protein
MPQRDTKHLSMAGRQAQRLPRGNPRSRRMADQIGEMGNLRPSQIHGASTGNEQNYHGTARGVRGSERRANHQQHSGQQESDHAGPLSADQTEQYCAVDGTRRGCIHQSVIWRLARRTPARAEALLPNLWSAL